MKYLLLLLKGLIMGIANIIPGVSGGTIAVSLGIYDDLIFSITNLFKKWQKSLQILVPLGAGLALGIVLFSYTIEFLLSEYALPTALAFTGLIIGGVPLLIQELGASMKQTKQWFRFSHISIFLIMLIFISGLSLIQEPESNFVPLELTASTVMALFLIGIIASATMVIPGISGSLVLMILGYYYSIINTLNSLIDSLLISGLGWNFPGTFPSDSVRRRCNFGYFSHQQINRVFVHSSS